MTWVIRVLAARRSPGSRQPLSPAVTLCPIGLTRPGPDSGFPETLAAATWVERAKGTRRPEASPRNRRVAQGRGHRAFTSRKPCLWAGPCGLLTRPEPLGGRRPRPSSPGLGCVTTVSRNRRGRSGKMECRFLPSGTGVPRPLASGSAAPVPVQHRPCAPASLLPKPRCRAP